MVKNVQKEKYPQHQTVANPTQPPYPPHTHSIHKTQDRHNNELPSPILNLHVKKINDNKNQ